MKQLLLVAVLLLGGAWVAAQSTSSSDQSGSSSGSSQAGSSQSGSATSGQTGSEMGQGSTAGGSHQSVEGCLSGSDGKYTLTDKQGTAYQLTGDTSKLAEHVGHEVRISGGSGSGAGSATSAGAGAGQTLEVKSVKHVSKTCQSGGGMAK